MKEKRYPKVGIKCIAPPDSYQELSDHNYALGFISYNEGYKKYLEENDTEDEEDLINDNCSYCGEDGHNRDSCGKKMQTQVGSGMVRACESSDRGIREHSKVSIHPKVDVQVEMSSDQIAELEVILFEMKRDIEQKKRRIEEERISAERTAVEECRRKLSVEDAYKSGL